MKSIQQSFGKKLTLIYAAVFLGVFILTGLIQARLVRRVLAPYVAEGSFQAEEIQSMIQRPVFFGMVMGILVVSILSLIIGRYVTRRIERMTRAAQQFAKGNLNHPIDVGASDELKVLADAMNEMARSLKERIAEVEGEKAKASAVLENLTEGVLAYDQSKVVLSVNAGVERIFGMPKETAVGKTVVEVVRSSQMDELVDRAMPSSEIISEEVALSSFEGRVLRASALSIKKGDVYGILVIRDITEVKKLENLRREFVANVSHELKTPLTSIKGFIETLLGGALSDRKRSESFLKIMEEDANRLTRLIDDILELSKIESKSTPLQIEDIAIQDEIEKVLQTFMPRISEKGIQIENKIARSPITSVRADRDKLRQVLINLLDNAIKYNKLNGMIRLDVRRNGNWVEFSVEDAGIGIPQTDLPRLFERFYSADKARSREQGGTGLGLAIVKHIIEAHGGKVSCRSRLDQGSVFIFTLPQSTV